MAIATHVIKINGEFDLGKWNEEKLKTLVKAKFKDIDKFWCPDLELFKIDGNKIDVWLFIETLIIEIEPLVTKWLKDHIKEEDITIKNIEVEKISYGRFNILLNDVAIENL